MRPLSPCEAAFEMGRISSRLCHPDVALDSLFEVASRGLDADLIGVAACPHGIERDGLRARVRADGIQDEINRFLTRWSWPSDDRRFATALNQLPRGKVLTRSVLGPFEELSGSRIWRELLEPLGISDFAIAVFSRGDGADLIFVAATQTEKQPLAHERLEHTQTIATCFGRAWVSATMSEPHWAVGAKPNVRRVLALVLEGLDDHQIAQVTGFTYHSVRATLKRLFASAGVRSRLHLIQEYRKSTGCASLPAGFVRLQPPIAAGANSVRGSGSPDSLRA